MQSTIQAIEHMFRAIETGDLGDVDTYIAEGYLNRESVDDGRTDRRGPINFGKLPNGFELRSPICTSTMWM